MLKTFQTLLGLLALASPAARALPSAQQARIIFVRHAHIWIMDARGGEATDLTPGDHPADRSPACSPDGRRIAFTRGDDLWVMDADGGHPTALTHGEGRNDHAAWSPDGKLIAFGSTRTSRKPAQFPELWVMAANGDHPVNALAGFQASCPSGAQPTWSRDGRNLIFVGIFPTRRHHPVRRGLCMIDLDAPGTPPWDLGRGKELNELDPAWGPDGVTIAYSVIQPLLGSRIMVRALEGGQSVQLTPEPETGTAPPGGLNERHPAWSPTGLRLAFDSNRDGVEAIWVMDPDGQHRTNLTPGIDPSTAPCWAPPVE